MTGLFAIYHFGRMLRPGDGVIAHHNALRVLNFERWAHLPDELAEQKALLTSKFWTEFANTYYFYVHLPATAVFLIWMFRRRPLLYPAVRHAMIGTTFVGLVVHLAFPLAPPRMLSGLGFIDTAARYGPNIYAGDPDHPTVVNQYAAMPSLHVGWAMLVAGGLIAATTTRWRWLWLLHPTLTAVAVVGTANHYWLDCIVGVVLLAVVTATFGRLPRAMRRREPARAAAGGVDPSRGPQAPAPTRRLNWRGSRLGAGSVRAP